MTRSCLTVVLAAGQGTRMKSELPKVLHPVAGLPMVSHVVATATDFGADAVAVVVGHGGDRVREVLAGRDDISFHIQERQVGTADALLAAREALEKGYDDVLVMFGDTPLMRAEVMTEVRAKLADGAAVAVVGFRAEDPTGYGRLIEKDGNLVAIREEKDASPEERAITLCNGGVMAFDGKSVLALADRIGNDNAKGEFYLTDAVGIAHGEGRKIVAIEASAEDVLGVNTRVELAEVESIWQHRARRRLLMQGVTMTAPETVYLHHDTRIAADATIEPNVVFGPGVSVAAGARIRSFSHLEGADVGPGAEVGPFARLRPGTELRERAKVGNFCEVKKAEIGTGAKVNHLTYVGDAVIGAAANIGAGTITCNYDGYGKYLTEIGEGAFIGSNSSLVAPVSIGSNAYVASGSVVTDNVPEDAVAFGRARQTNKEDLATKLRGRFKAAADARKAEKS